MENQDANHVIQIINVRIESQKVNRNLFTVFFTIGSGILAILSSQSISLPIIPWVSIVLLLFTLVFMLYGIYALTDSIHFHSKFLEYNYAWNEKVHGEAYKNSSGEEKAIKDYKRALVADDVGYHYLKRSILFFSWFLASFTLCIDFIDFILRIGICLLVATILTYMVVNVYQETHMKGFIESTIDFFIRKRIFK